MKLHQISIAIFVLLNYGIKVHSCNIASTGCGRRLVNHEPLIVDGYASREGSWPWHASILHINVDFGINYKCGGTLLNSNAILTAAHCVFENGQPIVPYRVLIQLGRNNLKISGPNSQDFEAFRIIHHPRFNISNFRNDIAIILLATEVTFNHYIQPICLWNANQMDLSEVVGKSGIVVGFGVTKADQISYTLQEAVMPVVSIATCLGSDNEFYGQFLSDFSFCAGFRNGTTACNGDSGGSLVFEQGGVYRMRGIVSLTQARTDQNRKLCKIDEYVIFTDIAKYLSWINENVLSLPLPPTPSIEVTTQKHNEPASDDAASVGKDKSEGLTWNGNWALGCEFKGNDLESVQTTGEECGGLCAAHPHCTHFTWNYGTCWLKQNAISKNDAILSRDRSRVCGVIIGEPITWNGNWALGCYFVGNDLKSVQSTGEECGSICYANPECTHFTWHYGTCQMKKYINVTRGDAVKNNDTSFTCGIIRGKV